MSGSAEFKAAIRGFSAHRTPCLIQKVTHFLLKLHHINSLLKMLDILLEAGYIMFQTVKYPFLGGKWFGAVITLFMRHNLMSLILKHNVTSFSQLLQHSTWRTNMRDPAWLVSNFVVISANTFNSKVIFLLLPLQWCIHHGTGPNQLIRPKNPSPCQDRHVKISTPPPTAGFS